jgi:hypothetical protein
VNPIQRRTQKCAGFANAELRSKCQNVLVIRCSYSVFLRLRSLRRSASAVQLSSKVQNFAVHHGY